MTARPASAPKKARPDYRIQCAKELTALKHRELAAGIRVNASLRSLDALWARPVGPVAANDLEVRHG